MSLYKFRPFTHHDLPMPAHWLQQAEVTRWWGDPAISVCKIPIRKEDRHRDRKEHKGPDGPRNRRVTQSEIGLCELSDLCV